LSIWQYCNETATFNKFAIVSQIGAHLECAIDVAISVDGDLLQPLRTEGMDIGDYFDVRTVLLLHINGTFAVLTSRPWSGL